ncbi:hypothetical protein HW555_010048 [Spodoptera exigua]|uniref:Uncharacterized protein n=1 Tax=Spodoptera exigua TaxID=7107 RepID=A0A835GBY0_SPOEX|nr:hypothetical protein HW555_010048 [Spodoptera exigua]
MCPKNIFPSLKNNLSAICAIESPVRAQRAITQRARACGVLETVHLRASVFVSQVELPYKKAAVKRARESPPPTGLVTPQPSDSEGEDDFSKRSRCELARLLLTTPPPEPCCRPSVIMRAHKDGTCSPEPLVPPPQQDNMNILKTLKFKMNRGHSYSQAKYIASQAQVVPPIQVEPPSPPPKAEEARVPSPHPECVPKHERARRAARAVPGRGPGLGAAGAAARARRARARHAAAHRGAVAGGARPGRAPPPLRVLVSRLREELLQVIPPESSRQNPHRRAAVPLRLGWVRASVLALGRAVPAQAHAYWGEEVRVSRVQPPLHALRPPRQAREETRQGARAPGARAQAAAVAAARHTGAGLRRARALTLCATTPRL